MKKLLIVFLVLSFALSSSFAFASDRYIFNHYTLFVDGELYRGMFNADFGYDTLMYDFLLYDDFSGGLLMKEQWNYGQRTNSGYQNVKYEKMGDGNFKLVFEDGSFFPGYWDKENDEDIWLCFGGDTYFRLSPVHNFDIQKDMVNK